MNQGKELDNILDECLDRILVRGETIEQCLARYPEHSAELEPLLRTAVITKEAAAIKPGDDFRERARYQFQAAIRDLKMRKERRFFGLQLQWATVVITILVLLVGGGSTVAAAQGSLPDEPLYPVKLTTEAVRIALTPSDLGKAELYVRLADRRVAEIVAMASKGKREQVERAAELLNRHLIAMASLAAPPGREGIPPAPLPPEAAVREAPRPAPPAPQGVPPPRVRQGPRVTVEEAAREPQEAPEVAVGGRDGVAKEVKPINRRAKIRAILARRAAANPQALRALLREAPVSVRPALRRAIAVADEGYERALKALD